MNDCKKNQLVSITAEYYDELVRRADNFFHLSEMITHYCNKKIDDYGSTELTEEQKQFKNGMISMYSSVLSILANKNWTEAKKDIEQR